jgi:plastocyanin
MLISRRLAAAAAAVVGLAVLAVPAVPAAAGGGCHRSMETGPTEGTGTTVELSLMCMNPTVLRVQPGTTVTFVNKDELLHNLYGAGWAHGDLAPGQSTSETFPTAGVYPYSCTLHVGMVGAIVVGDGHGSGRVVDIAPYQPSLPVAAAPAAAVRPADEGAGATPGTPLLIGLLAMAVVGGALGGGVVVRRRTSKLGGGSEQEA